MSKLDDFDLAILRHLQSNNRLTAETIAADIGLSAAACQRRIKRLRDSGTITADVSVVAPEAVGGRVTAIVHVVMAHGQANTIDTFKRRVRNIPQVQQCYYVTGDADFILVITAADIADYERLTREIFFTNSDIQKFHTSIVMDNVKAGLALAF